MTRKQFRTDLANYIKEVADFSSNGSIECNVDLIRHYLKEGKYDEIEKRLVAIEKCCEYNHSQMMQSYHAFEMMRHFALAVGEKYDPMY